jgi:hypothetical protein
MLKSQIVEASSFTQTQCDIKIPKALCASMKLCHVGVYGGAGFPRNGIVGQLNIISSIELMDGATVLSSYTDKLRNYLEYNLLKKSNNENRSLLKATNASNYGMVLNNGGADMAGNIIGKAILHEGAVRPRVCVDKRALKKSQANEVDSNLASLDLSMVLGFLNAQYKLGSNVVGNVIPCHLFDNLRLRLKFTGASNVCAGATTVAQPYLLFDEIVDDNLSNSFLSAKNNLIAEYADSELEQIYVAGTQTAVNNYLNGFYGKQVGNLVFMVDVNNGETGSPFQAGEQFKMTVNNNALLGLTSGINHEGKKAMYLRQSGIDLDIPAFADRKINLFGNLATVANTNADTVYEGNGGDASTETNYYNVGRLSYLSLPIDLKIDNMKLEYVRGAGGAQVNMLFWAEVGKLLSFDQSTGATTVSYL